MSLCTRETIPCQQVAHRAGKMLCFLTVRTEHVCATVVGQSYLARQHASLWDPFKEWNPKPKLSSTQCDNPKNIGLYSTALGLWLAFLVTTFWFFFFFLDIFFLWKLACVKGIKNTFVARSGNSAVLPLT